MKNGVFFSVLLITTSLLAEAPQQVGRFQDFHNFEFRGNEVFPKDALCKQLQSSATLFAFSRESRHLSTLLFQVQKELTRGYLYCGFPNPRVEVTWDDELLRPLVTIQEGPRLKNGEVRVEGVHEEIADSIRHWLTEKTPPLDAVQSMDGNVDVWRDSAGKIVKLQDPKWSQDRFCRLLPFTVKLLEPYVTRAIEEHGFQEPEIVLSLEHDLEAGRAHLRVNVMSIGETTEVDKITITGLEHHTREEILNFLEVELGHAITPSDILAMQRKLEACGRFQWHNIYINTKLFPAQPTELCIDLLECTEFPRITEELSEEQQSQVKLAKWFNRFSEQDADLLIELDGLVESLRDQGINVPSITKFQFCSSPQGALLISVTYEDKLLGGEETLTVALTREATEVMLKQRQMIYRGESQPLSPTMTLKLFGVPPPAEGRHSSMYYGFGIGTPGYDSKQTLNVHMSPFFSLYNFKDLVKSSEAVDGDDTVTYTSPTAMIRFNRITGQLIEMNSSIGETSDNAIVGARVASKIGLFEEMRLQAMQLDSQSPKQQPIVFDNAIEFITANLPAHLRNEPRIVSGMSLVSRGISKFMEENPKQESDEDTKFTIPPNMEVGTSPMGILALGITNTLLAENTQLWKLVRELVAVQILKDPQALPELLRIVQDPRNGPVMNWVFAEILAHVPFVPAENLAERGLEQLDGEQYLDDFRQLLNPNGKVGEFLISISAELRKLPANELDVLLAIIPETERKLVLQKQLENTSSDEDFALLLIQQTWHAGGLKEQLRQRLSLLSEDAAGNKLTFQID